ncbi:MAG: AAA-like domain-containing protein [Colwellia sp.]|uniref:AAA-like domain-containing protein n=1 Tax=Alteromonadales TaxID=135622 RepID=UPI001DED4477|nr:MULTISPECIES: AAA-like domain-containing protein [Alteromonadales]NQZ27908.1 AAA-like domain-containing protein [Colwellia sp.]NRA80349.1 AAA-like domain-containing protein [Pseudoalteromonas sp.]
MNHQEAKDLLLTLLPEEQLNLIKIEVFRLSWQGKGYNIIAEESGYDHDYVRKSGSSLWKALSDALATNVTKRNFRPLLETRLTESSLQRPYELEYPGGALPFSSPFYLERSGEEARAYNEIKQPGSVLRIKGPRKMGKSSLMLRVLDQAESEGYQIVKIDLLQADRKILSNLDLLLQWLCLQISTQLNIAPAMDDYWNPLMGSKLSCSNYLQQHILAQLDRPLVLVINELNLIFDHQEVSQDFLPLLRSWFEEAKHNAMMQKLRQVLVYSTEVYVQLDLNLSPFNVGLAIELQAFEDQQIAQLAKSYGFNWQADGMAANPVTYLRSTVSGHPYLTQLALYSLASSQGFMESPMNSLKDIIKTAAEPKGIYNEFLQQLLADLTANLTAVSGFRKLHGSKGDVLSSIESYQLERLGLATIVNGKTLACNQLAAKFLLKQL